MRPRNLDFIGFSRRVPLSSQKWLNTKKKQIFILTWYPMIQKIIPIHTESLQRRKITYKERVQENAIGDCLMKAF